MTTGVYLLHFDPPYRHAAHYLGYADDIEPRVNAHIHGRGARLTEVAHQVGAALWWVRTWEDAGRRDERRLKRWKHSPELCPICRGLVGVQLPLLPYMPAYVPTVEDLAEVA